MKNENDDGLGCLVASNFDLQHIILTSCHIYVNKECQSFI